MTSGRPFQRKSLCSVHPAQSYLSAGTCGQEPEPGEEEEREQGRRKGAGGERRAREGTTLSWKA